MVGCSLRRRKSRRSRCWYSTSLTSCETSVRTSTVMRFGVPLARPAPGWRVPLAGAGGGVRGMGLSDDATLGCLAIIAHGSARRGRGGRRDRRRSGSCRRARAGRFRGAPRHAVRGDERVDGAADGQGRADCGQQGRHGDHRRVHRPLRACVAQSVQRRVRAAGAPVLPSLLQSKAAEDIYGPPPKRETATTIR
jgi:hypothetical protein